MPAIAEVDADTAWMVNSGDTMDVDIDRFIMLTFKINDAQSLTTSLSSRSPSIEFSRTKWSISFILVMSV